MILTRTPFRMSFAGGGSDISSFYDEDPGQVVSTAIDKYLYVSLSSKYDKKIRLSYSITENVNNAEEINHPIVRESLKEFGITNGIEITSIADIPAGSGLGSSSAFTVGLLNALSHYLKLDLDKYSLAEKSCEIEINRCNEPIGKQDQFASSFGGLNSFIFCSDGTVKVEPILMDTEKLLMFQDSIIVFPIGDKRSASKILEKQTRNLYTQEKKLLMRKMVQLASELKIELSNNSLDNIGAILHENWLLKKQLQKEISNQPIDDAYQIAIKNGAQGGKLLGAGSSGFLIFYAPPEKHASIKTSLKHLSSYDLRFSSNGSELIYNDSNGI